MKWLYLYFPNLQLDLCHETEKDRGPFAIIDKSLNEVVQFNALAHDSGIKKHMGVASSIALCKELKVVSYDEKLEEEKIKDIAKQLYLITPDIFLDPPKGIYIDISSMSKLYPSTSKFWDSIVKTINTNPVAFQFSNSYSPLTAKLLAYSGMNRLLADKQNALTYLKSFHISSLCLDKNTEKALVHVGIRRLEQLLSIPLKDLAIRFDIELINTIGYLKGELKQKLKAYEPNCSFSEKLELMFDIGNISLLEKPILKLLKQFQSFLIARNLTTQEISLHLETSEGNLISVEVSSARAQKNAYKWLELTSLQLEQIKLEHPIRTLHLIVEKLQQDQFETASLLSNSTAQADMEDLITLLQTKLGKNSVLQLQYHPEHLPEKSTRLVTYLDDIAKPLSTDQSLYSIRPAFLLPEPIELKEQVELKSSPERIQTDWWDRELITRDYFIAENQTYQKFWVYRQPDRRWFLHGYFS